MFIQHSTHIMFKKFVRGVAAIPAVTKGVYEGVGAIARSKAENARVGMRADEWHQVYLDSYDSSSRLLRKITKYHVEKYMNRIAIKGLSKEDALAKKGLQKVKRLAFREWREIMFKAIQHIADENVFKDTSDIKDIEANIGNNRVNKAIAEIINDGGKLKRVLLGMQMKSSAQAYNPGHMAFTANQPRKVTNGTQKVHNQQPHVHKPADHQQIPHAHSTQGTTASPKPHPEQSVPNAHTHTQQPRNAVNSAKHQYRTISMPSMPLTQAAPHLPVMRSMSASQAQNKNKKRNARAANSAAPAPKAANHKSTRWNSFPNPKLYNVTRPKNSIYQ